MAGAPGLLLDANVLALWIVGQVSEEQVPRCRRTRHYSIADYRLLASYLSKYSEVIVTPNIATETSNLIGVLTGEYLRIAREILGAGLREWTERYVRSVDAAAERRYQRLGLTDAAILAIASRETEVLTDDFDLYRSLAERGVVVVNFTHLRAQQWSI